MAQAARLDTGRIPSGSPGPRALITTLTYSFARISRPEDEGRGPPAPPRRLEHPAP